MSIYTIASISTLHASVLTLHHTKEQLQCGPMPNVMAALPNIGGALCSTLQSLDGVPQTNEPISAVVGRSSPYCGGMWRKYCCLTSFFLIVDTCLSCEGVARQSCVMVSRLRIFGNFLRPVFSASPVQHRSDLHSKLALRPHHLRKYGRHPICDG